MLNSLEVLNGKMSPKYEEYNNLYTVNIDSEVDSLDIKYVLKDPNTTVDVVGNNNLLDGENFVKIYLSNQDKKEVINLNVYKNTVNTTTALQEYITELNVKDKMPGYIAPAIASVCFILIIIIFSLMFHKKRKY